MASKVLAHAQGILLVLELCFTYLSKVQTLSKKNICIDSSQFNIFNNIINEYETKLKRHKIPIVMAFI